MNSLKSSKKQLLHYPHVMDQNSRNYMSRICLSALRKVRNTKLFRFKPYGPQFLRYNVKRDSIPDDVLIVIRIHCISFGESLFISTVV